MNSIMIMVRGSRGVCSQLTNVTIPNVHQHVCISTAPHCCCVLCSHEVNDISYEMYWIIDTVHIRYVLHIDCELIHVHYIRQLGSHSCVK